MVIDKPAGPTSHDIVAQVRRILNTRRVGHTGTLDPFATGVLVVCIGRATRLVQFLIGEDKEYIATMRLGFTTDTGDLTGRPLSSSTDARDISEDQVEQAMISFRGRIKQVPPMYAAKKVGGVKLYELARRGEQVERAPVDIEIKELELCAQLASAAPSIDETRATKDFTFRIVCSSGTYIRALAEGIGQKLGCGAHLVELRRTRVGQCSLGQAITLDQLSKLADVGMIGETVLPMRAVLGLPEVYLREDERRDVLCGRAIWRTSNWVMGTKAALFDVDNELVAVAEYDASRQCWQPRVVIAVK